MKLTYFSKLQSTLAIWHRSEYTSFEFWLSFKGANGVRAFETYLLTPVLVWDMLPKLRRQVRIGLARLILHLETLKKLCLQKYIKSGQLPIRPQSILSHKPAFRCVDIASQ